MNGAADLGGMQGFGPVVDQPEDAPNYHADWESRVMGIVVALGAAGKWNIDQGRFARESINPADYLRFPYYRIWYEGVTRLLLKNGMVTEQELLDGSAVTDPVTVKRVLQKEEVWDTLHSLAGSAERPSTSGPSFQTGDKVVTINANPTGHTRLPRYARLRTGVARKVLGHHVFPDMSGNDKGDHAAWLYQIEFEAAELWGPDANANDRVTLDLWEPYLTVANNDS